MEPEQVMGWRQRAEQGEGNPSDFWVVSARKIMLPNFAKITILPFMSTMNISLPDSLKAFVDEQVNQRGYGTSSEYVRELIRKDQDCQQLRGLLIAGAASAPSAPADSAYFDGLRKRIRGSVRG